MSRTKRRKTSKPNRAWTHDTVFRADGSCCDVPLRGHALAKGLATWHSDHGGRNNAPAHFRRTLERRKRAGYRQALIRALRPLKIADRDVVLRPWRHDVNYQWW